MNTAPWFEDFRVGDELSDVPSVTLTEGQAAVHQALFADRSRLPLDVVLSEAVTGKSALMANSALVTNVAIGQSTVPSQRVMGNLFYRGLVIRTPVYLGDTLYTETRVVGLKQNRIKPGRPASGMVVLEIHTRNQRGETVLHFWRCPMVPCRNPDADTGLNDDFDQFPEEISQGDLFNVIPDWNFDAFRKRVPGLHASGCEIGSKQTVEARDTVTSAPELVRMTLNMAMTHVDAGRSVYGRRLVYGGHTISMAAAQLSRLYPNLLNIIAWYHCDHVAPVFEGDILSCSVVVQDTQARQDASLVRMLIEVFAERGEQAPEGGKDVKVLNWEIACLFASD